MDRTSFNDAATGIGCASRDSIEGKRAGLSLIGLPPTADERNVSAMNLCRPGRAGYRLYRLDEFVTSATRHAMQLIPIAQSWFRGVTGRYQRRHWKTSWLRISLDLQA